MVPTRNIELADRFFSNTNLGNELFDNDPLTYNEVVWIMADFLADPNGTPHERIYKKDIRKKKQSYLRIKKPIIIALLMLMIVILICFLILR